MECIMNIMYVKKRTDFIPLFILITACVFLLGSAAYAKESLLLIRPLGIRYKIIEKELQSTLGNHFHIEIVAADSRLDVTDIEKKISQISPKAVIAVDHQAFITFKKYQTQLTFSENPIASIALLPILPHSRGSDLKNGIIISYEVPIAASIRKLEDKLKSSITNVGIIYRLHMKETIQQHINLGKEKNIRFVTYPLENRETDIQQKLQNHLETLLKDHSVDALWIPDDPALFRPGIVETVWKPYMKKSSLLIIVPQKSLLIDNSGFGTACVLPDYKALGKQTAQTITQMMSNNWIVADQEIKSIDTFQSFFADVIDYLANSSFTRKQSLSADKNDNTSATVSSKNKSQPISEKSENQSTDIAEKQVSSSPQKTAVEVSSTTAANKRNRSEESINNNNSSVPKQSKLSEPTTDVVSGTSGNTAPDSMKETLMVSDTHTTITEAVTNNTRVKIIKPASNVTLSILSDSPIIAVAQQGKEYPLIAYNSKGYKIQYSDTIAGWIKSTDAHIVQNSAFTDLVSRSTGFEQPYQLLLVIGVAALILLIMFGIIIIVIVKRNNNYPVKIPNGKSCLIISRIPGKVQLSANNSTKISLKKYFTKSGFDVAVAQNLIAVKNVLLHYIPDIILVDWKFELNMQSKLHRMLSERSALSNLFIIFYNTVDSSRIKKELKFANTYYIDTSFTIETIYNIITPLISKRSEKQGDAQMENDLEGKITNHSLVEIFQLLDNEKRTGCLFVEHDEPFGMVFLNNGTIINAVAVNSTGNEAVFKVLSLNEGVFRFIPEKAPLSTNMNSEIFPLLLEWMKISDEAQLKNAAGAKNIISNPVIRKTLLK